jgi:hypothetical protein
VLVSEVAVVDVVVSDDVVVAVVSVVHVTVGGLLNLGGCPMARYII